mmetsp:Transcript_11368/g.23188  ORF Transcript_11368/g.23188 Transcript_11368/m.23188 type:complete len:127 (-) Transcript_11368:767-1147(-)
MLQRISSKFSVAKAKFSPALYRSTAFYTRKECSRKQGGNYDTASFSSSPRNDDVEMQEIYCTLSPVFFEEKNCLQSEEDISNIDSKQSASIFALAKASSSQRSSCENPKSLDEVRHPASKGAFTRA